MGQQKIADIVRRCRLSHPFEQWCICFAAQARWNGVHPELLRLLQDTFSGWTQSRLNEKANKVWRDACNRHSVNRKPGLTYLWDQLTQQRVLQEFEREEVQVGEDGPEVSSRYSEKEMQHLYKDATCKVFPKCGAKPDEIESIVRENAWLNEFNGILREEAKSFNPETEQLLVAEMRFLVLLREQNLWHKANNAWVTSLLPVDQVIHVKALDRYFWVLKTNECAALCWPAEQVQPGIWRKAKTEELTWHTCFELDEVEVLQLKVSSPLSLMLQERLHVSDHFLPN